MKKKLLIVENVSITVIGRDNVDFISLTDMVRESENGGSIIENWLRNKNTLEFLSVWEEIYNPTFNSLEFEGIKQQAGLNRFAISVKQWIARTNAVGNRRHRQQAGSYTPPNRNHRCRSELARDIRRLSNAGSRWLIGDTDLNYLVL